MQSFQDRYNSGAAPRKKVVRVNMSEMKLAIPDSKLSTTVGSCIALCIFDREKPIGAKCHIVLPTNPKTGSRGPEPPYKYADSAVPAMIKELIRKGASRQRLVSKLAGGANMFPGIKTQIENLQIGKRNIEATLKHLSEHGVPVISRDLAGNAGRRIEFEIESKKLMTATINGEVKML